MKLCGNQEVILQANSEKAITSLNTTFTQAKCSEFSKVVELGDTRKIAEIPD
jgi:hypothetical protein